jgi:hypothetical protein
MNRPAIWVPLAGSPRRLCRGYDWLIRLTTDRRQAPVAPSGDAAQHSAIFELVCRLERPKRRTWPNGAARSWWSITGRPGAPLPRGNAGLFPPAATSIGQRRSICRHQHRYCRQNHRISERDPGQLPAADRRHQHHESSAELGNTRQALPFTAVIDRKGRVGGATAGGTGSGAELELVSHSPQ